MTRSSLPSAPPISAGRLIGDKFEILDVLGEGGTGIVYDAVRLPGRDPIALKVIHNHLLGDKQIRGRFTREAAILRRLDGPHLCPILEFGELPDPRHEGQGLLFIALPKIEGPALDQLLRDEGPLVVERALDIVLQVCKGLKAAHAQGVIHRDLKPANVIMRGGTHAVVVDFGMAKIVTGYGGTGTTALTSHNMVFGTPEYMSPEQARGDELDARCDVYAAGVILYELLTGSVPFSGATPLSVLTAHLTSSPTLPRVRAPERPITVALEAVVMHAIAKDPEKRYATAAAFAAAISKAHAEPNDSHSIRPEAFSPTGNANSDDAHAETIPFPEPTDPRKLPTLRPDPRKATTVRPPKGEGLGPANDGLSVRTWGIIAVVAAVSILLGILVSLKTN